MNFLSDNNQYASKGCVARTLRKSCSVYEKYRDVSKTINKHFSNSSIFVLPCCSDIEKSNLHNRNSAHDNSDSIDRTDISTNSPFQQRALELEDSPSKSKQRAPFFPESETKARIICAPVAVTIFSFHSDKEVRASIKASTVMSSSLCPEEAFDAVTVPITGASLNRPHCFRGSRARPTRALGHRPYPLLQR
ncbi:hypothetical protein HNY73_012165 [Argiope bruennichi]|uniref:Uncharacterized protein n=1 Tax=Argiope bruennichi TaxID=94029 RepID=A0A8T0EU12_ARGBR|nr:hypothetical protein HNY73_012165 [Argiope bruennichi]